VARTTDRVFCRCTEWYYNARFFNDCLDELVSPREYRERFAVDRCARRATAGARQLRGLRLTKAVHVEQLPEIAGAPGGEVAQAAVAGDDVSRPGRATPAAEARGVATALLSRRHFTQPGEGLSRYRPYSPPLRSFRGNGALHD
jgi:hypothetical protein